MEAELVSYLLNLLGNDLDICKNSASTKAQIVKALKSMAKNLTYGEKITSILDKSDTWAQYKDQRHDLFISSVSSSSYLTGM